MPLDPDCFLLKTFKVTAQEACISRYSRDLLIHNETLLEHIGWVSTWCYLVAKDMEDKIGTSIKYDVLLKSAVIHDIDEVLTGDVPAPTKYANKDLLRAFKELEDVSTKLVVEDLTLKRTSVYREWKDSKDVTTLEGYLVKLADMASVVYKVWHETLLLGNNSFARVAKEVLKILFEMQNPAWFGDKPEEAEYLSGIMDDMISLTTVAVNHTDSIQKYVAAPLELR